MTQCPLCGPEYMGGPHTAGSGNCMVRAADINVCGCAACSRRQREKRDAKNGGFWPLGLGTMAWDRGLGFQFGQSLPKVAVACGDRSHGSWRVLGVMIGGRGRCRRSVCRWQTLTLTATAGYQNRDLPSPAFVAVHSSGEGPGNTRSAVWHNLLADWESLPSTRGAPVRLPSPSTD